VRHWVPVGLLAVGLVTCRPERITTSDPVVLGAADAWAGQRVVLWSTSFTGADSLPLVLDTLPVQSAGMDSIAVQLPDTDAALVLTIRLHSGGGQSVPVRVHGFVGVGDGPLLGAFTRVYPWPGNGNSTALATQEDRLVLFDAHALTLSAALVPDSVVGCHANEPFTTLGLYWIPLPSATVPGVVTVHGACDLSAVPLAVSLTRPAEPVDTGGLGWGWPTVHISRGKWLATDYGGVGFFNLYTRTDSGGFTVTPGTCVKVLGAEVSPRRDRIVPTFATCQPHPVYDAATAAVAYEVSSLVGPDNGPAGFTPEGDTLYMAGIDSAGQQTVLALDATSGTVLARAALREANSILEYELMP
jgi:hypothetical protein